jgi:hydroxymethylglutaryl-CoA lyase
MAERAEIREVGPRDGLQLVGTILATERKLEWCARTAAAGVRRIEVTSFVPPSVVPQFADAAEVARRAVAMGGFDVAALVPNLRGAEYAIAAGVHTVNFVTSASDWARVRRTRAQSLEDFARIVAHRDAVAPGRVRIGGCVATAFGCSIAGAVPEADACRLAEAYVAAGADELVVADTVGVANPAQVRRLLRRMVAIADGRPVICHFHDTRGLGLANVVAALDAGVRIFDAALAGLGGCPFAPGASGNIDTEDTAYLLEAEGFATGIDIEALIALRREVEDWLPGERFAGAIARAGVPSWFRRAAV